MLTELPIHFAISGENLRAWCGGRFHTNMLGVPAAEARRGQLALFPRGEAEER